MVFFLIIREDFSIINITSLCLICSLLLSHMAFLLFKRKLTGCGVHAKCKMTKALWVESNACLLHDVVSSSEQLSQLSLPRVVLTHQVKLFSPRSLRAFAELMTWNKLLCVQNKSSQRTTPCNQNTPWPLAQSFHCTLFERGAHTS